MTDTEQSALSYFAEQGDYYSSASEIPKDILVSTIRAMERVLSAPDKFPRANFDLIERSWPALCGVAAGRLIFIYEDAP